MDYKRTAADIEADRLEAERETQRQNLFIRQFLTVFFGVPFILACIVGIVALAASGS